MVRKRGRGEDVYTCSRRYGSVTIRCDRLGVQVAVLYRDGGMYALSIAGAEASGLVGFYWESYSNIFTLRLLCSRTRERYY